MRRSLAAIAGTAAGLAALLSYKSGPAPRRINAAGQASGEPTTAPGASPATTSPLDAAGQRTVQGPDEPNRFGDVQVEVVMQGNRLVDVRALQLPFDRPRSKYISDQAAPILRQEALDAQGANIDLVGGATYTSDGYARSLQAALDQARR